MFRCELLLLHEPEHDRVRRYGARFLSTPPHPPRVEERDRLVLLVLHNVRDGAYGDVLQHTTRRDRAQAKPSDGEAGAG